MIKVNVSTEKVIKSSFDKEGKLVWDEADDLLAIEEPLEIRIVYKNSLGVEEKNLAITMRTPCYDFELVLGFLFNEGIIQQIAQVKNIRYCNSISRMQEEYNIIKVELIHDISLDWGRLQRNFYTTSSCGVCGKSSIDSIKQAARYPLRPETYFSREMIHSLSGLVQGHQALFHYTGGLHASALFDKGGNLILLREDVGRHNALDKVIGAMLAKETLPLHDHLLWVSGRASFELVQKAIMAGIAVMVAVGAPSSLAVDLAREANMTLVGFARNNRFNIYTGKERIS